MKDIPIIFSGPMIPPIIVDLKTHTRRLNGLKEINKTPDEWKFENFFYASRTPNGEKELYSTFENKDGKDFIVKSPYGKSGDKLWVRENMSVHDEGGIEYLARSVQTGLASSLIKSPDFKEEQIRWFENYGKSDKDKTIPSIHMPRWAARILLEVLSIRVERVQDISQEDSYAEGVGFAHSRPADCGHKEWKRHNGNQSVWDCSICIFKMLWTRINGARGFGWDVNPWVWVVEFKRIKA
jgi:hypothetical protein